MDHQDREEFLTQNLEELVSSTLPSTEMAISLLSRKLIAKSEHQAMTNKMANDYDKATDLYTKLAPKWSDDQFTLFIQALKETGNDKAYEILTADGAEVFLTRSQVEFLRTQKNKLSENSTYEGIRKEDEEIAGKIQSCFKKGNLFQNDKFQLDSSLKNQRTTIVPLIKSFVNAVKAKNVWINHAKIPLPKNYIERRVYHERGVLRIRYSLLNVVITKEDKLVLLVDAPGMGKSSVLTKLEMDMRINSEITSPRIIIRKNLNECSSELSLYQSQGISLEFFMEKFANFVSGNLGHIPVYILLDGLDEVLPTYKVSMLKLLKMLLSDHKSAQGYFVKKVILTTRPHLKELIENEFQVKPYFLDPLSKKEQIQYLMDEVCAISTIQLAQQKLHALPKSARDLMSNPLMLHLFSQVCTDTEKVQDLFSLYTRFMEKKLELFVCEKEKANLTDQTAIRRKNMLLKRNDPYYYIAIDELLLAKKNREIILSLDRECEGENVITQPEEDELEELLSHGLVVQGVRGIRFKHKSFAEFFYAKVMTDIQNTPEKLRNALFALGFKKSTNIASFVSCIIRKDKEAVRFVSKGWSEFIPMKAKFANYLDAEGGLVDHLLNNTIDFEEECARKNWTLLTDSFIELTKWFTEPSLFERAGKWMTLDQMKFVAHQRLKNDANFSQNIIKSPYLSSFIACIFSRDEIMRLIADQDIRITDGEFIEKIMMCWGKEYCPQLLKFRFNFGDLKGKSLFQKQVPENLFEKVWEEIHENIQDAIEIVHDDGDFEFIRHLENDLRRLTGSSEGNRRELLIAILAGVDWRRFDGSNWRGYHLLAYGKMTTEKWEELLNKKTLDLENSVDLTADELMHKSTPTIVLNGLLGCLLLSACAADTPQAEYGPPPFELVRQKVSKMLSKEYLIPILTRMNREELSDLARVNIRDPVLLNDLPSVGEIFFHPEKGLAYTNREETITILKEKKVMQEIIEDLFFWRRKLFLSSGVFGKLGRMRKFFQRENEDLFKEGLGRSYILYKFADGAMDLWLMDVDIGKEYTRNLVQVYMEIFETGDKGGYWIDVLSSRIPVQLLVVIEEKGSNGDLRWSDLLRRVMMRISEYIVFLEQCPLFSYGNKFWKYDFMYRAPLYNRECDWYSLFWKDSKLQEKIPANFKQKNSVHLTQPCSLLRVLIQLFGEKEIMRRAHEMDCEINSTFLELTAMDMKDGELLHLAVEIGSLRGVKSSAWPSFINWTIEDKTALELAKEKWGKDHEITKFLERETKKLVASGYLSERKSQLESNDGETFPPPPSNSS